MKPKRKQRMWWREQMAASDSSLFVWLFFFLLLPPVPAASLTAWPPLEQHKQLETIDWARASQNISGTVAHRNKIQEGLAELKVNYFSDTRLKLINYEYINSKTFNSKKILIKKSYWLHINYCYLIFGSTTNACS